MAASVETDYTALVERRTWAQPQAGAGDARAGAKAPGPATRLFYDAYLNFGSLEYIVGDLPFFIRWFIRYDGVHGDKRRGVEQLKLAASRGRYYGPFARILLVVVSLRERKLEDAKALLAGLVEEFPENHLFRKELALVTAQAARKRR